MPPFRRAPVAAVYADDALLSPPGVPSARGGAADVEAFLQSEGYGPVPGKPKPLVKGAMISRVYPVHAPPK